MVANFFVSLAILLSWRHKSIHFSIRRNRTGPKTSLISIETNSQALPLTFRNIRTSLNSRISMPIPVKSSGIIAGSWIVPSPVFKFTNPLDSQSFSVSLEDSCMSQESFSNLVRVEIPLDLAETWCFCARKSSWGRQIWEAIFPWSIQEDVILETLSSPWILGSTNHN